MDLDGHCSILHDNTLYVYTPSKLLSLSLKKGAKWKELGQGHSVTNAECTKGLVDGDNDHPALYVVGGETDSPDYSGLQRYSLLDHKWKTLPVNGDDLQKRVKHAAIFLRPSSSILVYAGTTDENPNPSTQTFLVDVEPPYRVRSFNSTVPPAIAPLLLPWSEDEAVMVGGGAENKKIYSFSGSKTVWTDTGARLKKPLPDRSTVKCATVSGDDGSKVLQVFDMGVSPNTVTRYVLLGADGSPASPGKTVGSVSELKSSSKKRRSKRDGLSLSDYPSYDDKHAPETTRNGFSLAQTPDGKVVLSGGADKKHAVSIFDQSENSWVDTEQLFLGSSTSSSVSSSTATSTSTSSSSSSSSSTSSSSSSLSASASATIDAAPTSSGSGAAAAKPSDDGKNHTLTIVGATLGAVLGLAAILILILLFLGWKKKKAKYPNGKGGEQDKDRLSFQDQGMEPLTKSMQPMGRGGAPSGTDSWALVAGQADSNPRKPPPATFNDFNFGTEKGRSPLRNVENNNVPDGLSKETGGAGVAGLGAGAALGDNNNNRDASRGERLTDEGWAKYFQGDNGHREGRGGGGAGAGSDRSSQETKSDYGTDSWPHASAEVPPLTLNTLDQPRPLGRVASGSPSREQLPHFDVAHQGMAAKISSADSASVSSIDSNEDHQDAFSSGVPASIPDESGWTPGRSPFAQDRVVSSNYSDSLYANSNNNNNNNNNSNSDHRMTQWPNHMPFGRDSGPANSNRKPGSDVSWLHLGSNNR